MTFMTVDHTQAQQGRYMPPEGDYECVIKEARFDHTQKGTEYLRITLDIRDDIPQEGAGESIEWPVWKKREPTSRDPHGFALGTIQHISRVVGFENGQTFATIDDWMNGLKNRPIKVEVRHEEYNGTTRARVGYVFETEHPQMALKQQGFLEVGEDEELPF